MRISDWSSDVCSSDLFFTAVFFAAVFFVAFFVAFLAVAFFAGAFLAAAFLAGAFFTAAFLPNRPRIGLPVSSISFTTSSSSEEHTSELQSLMRNTYAVFCLKKKKKTRNTTVNKQ